MLELVHKTPFNLIHDLERKLDEMKENSIDQKINDAVVDAKKQIIEIVQLNNKGTEL